MIFKKEQKPYNIKLSKIKELSQDLVVKFCLNFLKFNNENKKSFAIFMECCCK